MKLKINIIHEHNRLHCERKILGTFYHINERFQPFYRIRVYSQKEPTQIPAQFSSHSRQTYVYKIYLYFAQNMHPQKCIYWQRI